MYYLPVYHGILLNMSRNRALEGVYIAAYSQMVELVGILATDRIIKLLKHFYFAPNLQIAGYIIKIMESEGYDDLRYDVIANIVRCNMLFKQETDHVLTREIARKKIGIPFKSIRGSNGRALTSSNLRKG